MSSIYRVALGDEFERLHPKLQWRFGFSSADRVCQIGTGIMEEIWRGPWWTVPFLYLGATRRILFPSRGHDVPFSLSNYAYVDSFGRETVTWSRHFGLPRRPRTFDATMIYSENRGTIVDYLGTHQHLTVDLACSVDDSGAMCLRSGAQRFYEHAIAFRFPQIASGVADVREWWDESSQRFRIDVRVTNRILGPLFGYRGSFVVAERSCSPEQVPSYVRPRREERRE